MSSSLPPLSRAASYGPDSGLRTDSPPRESKSPLPKDSPPDRSKSPSRSRSRSDTSYRSESPLRSRVLSKSPSRSPIFKSLSPPPASHANRSFLREKHVDHIKLQAVDSRIPPSKAKSKFEERQKKELQDKSFDLEQLIEIFTKLGEGDNREYNLKDLQEALSKTHPVFALAWECANEEHPIKLVEDAERSYYSAFDHTIHICVFQDNIKGLLENLFSCTLLALHTETFERLNRKPIDRESYTIMKTYIIFCAEQLSEQLLHPLFPEEHVSTKSYQKHWEEINAPTVGGVSVAEQIRIDWDKDYLNRFAE